MENVFRAMELWPDGPQLAISGNILGNHKAKLEKLASSLNIENRVTWLGYVPDDLLPNLYSEASLPSFFLAFMKGLVCRLWKPWPAGARLISSNMVQFA